MGTPRPLGAAAAVTACFALAATVAAAGQVSVKSVEALEGNETVVKVHLSGPLEAVPLAQLLPKGGDQPDRLSIDLPGADMHGKPARTAEVGWGGVQRIRLGMPSANAARIVLDLDHPFGFDVARDGDVVTITLHEPHGDVTLYTGEAPSADKPADAKPK